MVFRIAQRKRAQISGLFLAATLLVVFSIQAAQMAHLLPCAHEAFGGHHHHHAGHHHGDHHHHHHDEHGDHPEPMTPAPSPDSEFPAGTGSNSLTPPASTSPLSGGDCLCHQAPAYPTLEAFHHSLADPIRCKDGPPSFLPQEPESPVLGIKQPPKIG